MLGEPAEGLHQSNVPRDTFLLDLHTISMRSLGRYFLLGGGSLESVQDRLLDASQRIPRPFFWLFVFADCGRILLNSVSFKSAECGVCGTRRSIVCSRRFSSRKMSKNQTVPARQSAFRLFAECENVDAICSLFVETMLWNCGGCGTFRDE